ncbi:MAG: hypothetical protein QF645_10565, partial [Planctomycetota bacterium]|nr:hypothetical protein [Planctomycetota bacterium]
KVVTLSNPEAKRFSCGLVALKGEIGARVFNYLKENPDDLPLLTIYNSDTLKLLEVSSPKPRSVPSSRVAKPRFTSYKPRANAKMLYFIPEWDDRVDPDYDFSCDGITQDRDPYNHDVYAHEIYPTPNYDGILVSKSVIEDNKKKKARIESIGIHAHIRVPRNFPIMGDCGAFNYIDEEIPPYTTDETLHFYQDLDFDFGVSIDHLIVPKHLKKTFHGLVDGDGNRQVISAQEYEQYTKSGVKGGKRGPATRDLFDNQPYLAQWEEKDLSEAKRRWELTLANSRDFIQKHKTLGCSFVPIAGCQGWDVDSETEMFRLQQDMGYDYIALGGLVRSKTEEILRILDEVNKIRKPSTRVQMRLWSCIGLFA